MVVNQDHFINRILHEAGKHLLTVEELDTPWVAVAARILVDPADEDDVTTVNALQDQLAIEAKSSRPFETPDYDTASLNATRIALLELAKHLGSFDHAFGAKSDVDPVRHLVATAAGWGGLPDREARYIGVEPAHPVGEYKLTVRDGPVDGFWSISVYNAKGFLEPNDRHAYSVNNVTAAPNDDGSVTVYLRLRQRSAELPADHGRLELHGPALPAPARGARRLLDVSRDPTCLTACCPCGEGRRHVRWRTLASPRRPRHAARAHAEP